MKKCLGLTAAGLLVAFHVQAAELWVGAAEVSITPDRPISLAGQFHQRISKKVESPCMANIVALEAREAGKPVGQAVMISLDVVSIPVAVQRDLRALLGGRLAGFDTNMLFLAATHSHTGPTLNQARFDDYGEAMQPKEYVPYMLDRVAEAVVKAWEGRKPGAVAWGLGHAVVGHNRRVVYADGSAVMYGKVDKPTFRGLEGWEDHAVDVVCFTDAERRLVATVLAVPCPSQVVEGLYEVSADFWHHVREGVKARHGEGVVVVGFCGPAGDQVPRPMLRVAAEARMERLRKLSRKQELGRRIVAAFDETWEAIRNDLRADVPFAHRVECFQVPGRKLTDKEYEEAQRGYAEYAKRDQKETAVRSRMRWYKRTLDRYEEQQKVDPVNKLEIHVLRVGDLALATNPFELFVDYAMRIHGRSPAGQTMLVQLASPADERHSYLPSERAVKGGGYSAVPQSSPVGPEGGQMLVEKTLATIQALFPTKK
ncbi:MAG TPA: hypothetical protein P5026_01310 [Kiritimatiellia bacterium]|nr:hypothetical protein [Kiritimatiellia bacterium]HRU69756.1 hypothetical protein [Kiritimatiellia bacterium]